MGCTLPIVYIKNGKKTIPLYTHSIPLILFEKVFSFEGARLEKGIKI